MYSTKKNIQQLLSLMEQHGVTDVVLSPGSRNLPLSQSFAAHPSFTCHAVTDERSAGFFAIGLALNKKRPTAVCVTSGSALLNLASAVSEAYYQQVPLLVAILNQNKLEEVLGIIRNIVTIQDIVVFALL